MADSIAWEQMRARAQSKGLLAKQLFVVRTLPTAGGIPAIESVLAEHLAYQADLENRGIMFAAGPLANAEKPDQWSGDGLIVIRAQSMEEARSIAENDPMHKSGARTFTVNPWLVNEGTLTVSVSFASGKRDII